MKYIIEIEEQPLDVMDGCTQVHPTLYRAKGFKTLVFDEVGLKKLKPCEGEREQDYQQGLNDAWACARKITCLKKDGGIPGDELVKVFGNYIASDIVKYFSASEAMEKIKDYEEEQEEKKSQIKVGDEVIRKDGTKAVVLDESLLENCWKVITENRTVEPWHKTLLKKTGRNFDDIQKLLEKLRGEE